MPCSRLASLRSGIVGPALQLTAALLLCPTPGVAQGINCICRLNPVANFGSYFLYKVERRETCESPEGQGDCSTPSYAYVMGAPGLPPQACGLGECQPNAYVQLTTTAENSGPEAQPPNEQTAPQWALPAPYGADFALHTPSNSNPAYFALFPSGERPATAVAQDFTLRGVVDGRDAYVRVFKAAITLHFSAEGGESEPLTIPVASGMEFADADPSDNIVLPADATEPAADGQPYCRKFSHPFPDDGEPIEVVVLLVEQGKETVE